MRRTNLFVFKPSCYIFIAIYIYICMYIYVFFLWRCDPTRVMASSFFRFLDHTQRRTTFGRTSLDEWSPRRRDLYLTTHDTHNRQTSIPPVGFEPTISAGERPQTYTLYRAATGTGIYYLQTQQIFYNIVNKCYMFRPVRNVIRHYNTRFET